MLTGRTRYRIGFRKKLVMQVEEWVYPLARYAITLVEPYSRWRDATLEDMQAIARGDIHADKPGPRRRYSITPPPNRRPNENPRPTHKKPPPPPPPPPMSVRPQSRFVRSG